MLRPRISGPEASEVSSYEEGRKNWEEKKSTAFYYSFKPRELKYFLFGEKALPPMRRKADAQQGVLPPPRGRCPTPSIPPATSISSIPPRSNITTTSIPARSVRASIPWRSWPYEMSRSFPRSLSRVRRGPSGGPGQNHINGAGGTGGPGAAPDHLEKGRPPHGR